MGIKYKKTKDKMVKKYDWYKADNDTVTPNRHQPKAPKMRASIVPGQVLILLSGRFRGKRVVALKQLKSGLVAITGPYKINGVPVKRVNQVYTMSTSTRVKMDGVKTDAISDDTFKKEAVKKTRQHKFFKDDAPKAATSDARKKLQKDVDTALMKNISDKMERKYLGSRFSLGKHD